MVACHRDLEKYSKGGHHAQAVEVVKDTHDLSLASVDRVA